MDSVKVSVSMVLQRFVFRHLSVCTFVQNTDGKIIQCYIPYQPTIIQNATFRNLKVKFYQNRLLKKMLYKSNKQFGI